MGQLCADDLRLVVVRLIEEEHTRPEVGEHCGISLSSVCRGLRRYRAEALVRTRSADETATSMTRRGGRSARGQRLVCKVPFGCWQSVTMVAALRA
jgi:hypothetical protein